MTWKIEKRSYSSSPWRLIDETGNEVYHEVTIDYPDLGKTNVSMPICGRTKQSVVDQVLAEFVAMHTLLRKRTFALKAIQAWANCDPWSNDNVNYVCRDALSGTVDDSHRKGTE